MKIKKNPTRRVKFPYLSLDIIKQKDEYWLCLFGIYKGEWIEYKKFIPNKNVGEIKSLDTKELAKYLNTLRPRPEAHEKFQVIFAELFVKQTIAVEDSVTGAKMSAFVDTFVRPVQRWIFKSLPQKVTDMLPEGVNHDMPIRHQLRIMVDTDRAILSANGWKVPKGWKVMNLRGNKKQKIECFFLVPPKTKIAPKVYWVMECI